MPGDARNIRTNQWPGIVLFDLIKFYLFSNKFCLTNVYRSGLLSTSVHGIELMRIELQDLCELSPCRLPPIVSEASDKWNALQQSLLNRLRATIFDVSHRCSHCSWPLLVAVVSHRC